MQTLLLARLSPSVPDRQNELQKFPFYFDSVNGDVLAVSNARDDFGVFCEGVDVRLFQLCRPQHTNVITFVYTLEEMPK